MTSAMPSGSRRFRQGIEQYIAWCAKRGLAPVTVNGYRGTIRRCHQLLQEAGLETGIRRIGEAEIDHLRSSISGGQGYIKQEIVVFGSFLRYHGNDIVNRMAIRWPHIDRPNVQWHTEEEQALLMAEAEDLELLVLHFGLDLLMRRCEMMRLNFEDIDQGVIRIRGKGQGGGKIRTVPTHPSTPYFMQLARKLNGAAKGPIFRARTSWRDGRPSGRSLRQTAMDNILKRLESRTGIHTTYHTLRRTGGRNLWQAGVSIEVVAQIMGHEDIRTTKRYLGINLNDMMEAFRMAVSARKGALHL